MRKKYEPQVAPDLIRDILSAQKAVRKALKNQAMTMRLMKKLIRSWQGELGSLRRRGEAPRVIRLAELSLVFLKAIHEENLGKYESYYREQ
jgi:hypothetical protein